MGIDIGGTNVKLTTLDDAGRVQGRASIPTRADEPLTSAFKRIKVGADELLGNRKAAAVGLGCAGLVDPAAGRLRTSPNLPKWAGAPIGRLANRAFGVQVNIENDANCAAYGEYRAGKFRGADPLIFITLGTGVGGGVVANGDLVVGAGHAAGELGHMTVDPDGPKCACGQRGCAEAFAGAWAMERFARQEVKVRTSRVLSRMYVARERITAQAIADAARKRDAIALATIKRAAEHLGIAVASAANLINPRAVVIGGGVSASFDLWEPHLVKAIQRNAFAEAAAGLKLSVSRLGNDATGIGAALLAADKL